jgi:transforming growth factor-beta-induced protein
MMNVRMVILGVMVILFALLIAGCAAPTPPTTPTPTSTTALPTTTTTPVTPPTIVETAAGDARFTTLVTALQAANLTDALSGPGPFTVFAPTNDAFDKLPAGTVSTLLQDPGGQLTQILLYHVVAGEYSASALMNQTNLTTLQGSDLSITVVNGTVNVDGATVIIADIECSNGVIHAIDSVMIPPEA